MLLFNEVQDFHSVHLFLDQNLAQPISEQTKNRYFKRFFIGGGQRSALRASLRLRRRRYTRALPPLAVLICSAALRSLRSRISAQIRHGTRKTVGWATLLSCRCMRCKYSLSLYQGFQISCSESQPDNISATESVTTLHGYEFIILLVPVCPAHYST